MTRDEFVNSLKSIDKAPFLFLGSGFSRHYIDTPTWEGILGKFSNKPINQYKSTLNTDSLPFIATELSKDLTNDFWNSPEDDEFYLAHKNEIQDQSSVLKIRISEYLKEMSLKQFPSCYDKEIKLLANLNIDGIITTNWDDTIERIFPKYKTFVGQKELLLSSTFSIGEIYKIHGSFREPSSMILTEEDYIDFSEKYPYLAAKLITIFVEHPVIFIGYSMSDPNIQDLLKTIMKCLDETHISRMQNKLVFVEWSQNDDSMRIERHDIAMKDGILLPVTRIKTGNFALVYECLSYYERKIPADVLREYKKQFFDIVVSEKPERKILALSDSKVDMDSSIQIVYGFGAIDKYMTANGYIGLSAMDIMKDVLKEEKFYDAEKILTKSLLTITKQCPTIFIPIYKYLSNVGIHSDEEYRTSLLDLHYKLRKGIEFQAYKSVLDSDKKKTLQEAISDYTGKNIWKAVVLIPYLNVQEKELPLLASFIGDNMEEMLRSSHSTYMRKLICFYDWKKYGWD